MLTLCGFSLSNDYNKVKLVLLEKGLPFEEECIAPGPNSGAVLAASPLGKVPFLRRPQGTLCESAVICEYLEQPAPGLALLPADPWAAAKARDLYPQALFGGSVIEPDRARGRELLDKHIAGFRRLESFMPYVAGDTFTLADRGAYAHLSLVALAMRAIYGEGLLAGNGIDWKAHGRLVGQRAPAQRVDADRKADQAASLAAATTQR